MPVVQLLGGDIFQQQVFQQLLQLLQILRKIQSMNMNCSYTTAEYQLVKVRDCLGTAFKFIITCSS